MNSLHQLVFAKTLVAAAIVASGLGAGSVASANPTGTPDDGMNCRSAPDAYTGTLTSNKFFCKRTKNVNQALTCSEPGFPTKFIREGPGGGGKDVCAAPNRSYPSNLPLTGTEGVDWKYVAAGSTQVSTILANQRQQEATATGLQLSGVDARALSSEVVVNHTGSEDKLKVTIEFAVYATPAPASVVIGGPVVGAPLSTSTSGSSTVPFAPRPLP